MSALRNFSRLGVVASSLVALPLAATAQNFEGVTVPGFEAACVAAGAETLILPCPFRQVSTCIGEGCLVDGDRQARRDISLYAEPGSDRAIYRMIAGEIALAETTDVFVVPCRATALSDEGPIRTGQTVYRLAYGGEGTYRFWADGQIVWAPSDFRSAIAESCPIVAEEWVRLRTRDGLVAWTRTGDFVGGHPLSGDAIDPRLDPLYMPRSEIGPNNVGVPSPATQEQRGLAEQIITVTISAKTFNNSPNGVGSIAGILSITSADGVIRSVRSYNSGADYGSAEADFQCVDLIKRYGAAAGFLSTTELLLGNGNKAAAGFARAATGFSYVSARSPVQAAMLPAEGAVLSIAAYPGNPYGHVGIVTGAQMDPDGETYSLTLFDQNWPSSDWKMVTFRLIANNWQGSMSMIASNGKTLELPVEGWANPVSSNPLAGSVLPAVGDPPPTAPDAAVVRTGRFSEEIVVSDATDLTGTCAIANWMDCYRALGMSEPALSFAGELYDLELGNPFAVDFTELGPVDLVETLDPFRANSNTSFVMVNGEPLIVDGHGFYRSLAEFEDGASRRFVASYPSAYFHDAVFFLGHRVLAGGGQRFVFSNFITDGCRACRMLGNALYAFDFGPDGSATRRFLIGIIDYVRFGLDFFDPLSPIELLSNVAALQYELNRRGYEAGPIDGVVGSLTNQALLGFQRDFCLVPTGVLDIATANSLLNAPAIGQSCVAP